MRTVVAMVVMWTATATADPSAPLAKVDALYGATPHLTAKFRQVATNRITGTSKSVDGKLWVDTNPQRYRFDYNERTNRGAIHVTRSMMSDGTTSWAVDHASRRIVAVSSPPTVPEVIDFVQGNLAARYDVASGRPLKANIVLELTPKQSNIITKLTLEVSTVDYHVVRAMITDASGSTNETWFFEPNVVTPPQATWFQVTPTSMPGYQFVP